MALTCLAVGLLWVCLARRGSVGFTSLLVPGTEPGPPPCPMPGEASLSPLLPDAVYLSPCPLGCPQDCRFLHPARARLPLPSALVWVGRDTSGHLRRRLLKSPGRGLKPGVCRPPLDPWLPSPPSLALLGGAHVSVEGPGGGEQQQLHILPS